MRLWRLHQRDGRKHVKDLHNAWRLKVLRILVGRGGCFGREMLDACNQVGWKLHEAHQQIDTKPGYAFLLWVNLLDTKALLVHTTLF